MKYKYAFVTSFFVNMYDSQYKKTWSPEEEKTYLGGWVKSFLKFKNDVNYQAFIFHNGLQKETIKELSINNINFIDVSKEISQLPKLSPHDLRFLLYPKFMDSHNKFDFFFFTDARDVKIINFSEEELLSLNYKKVFKTLKRKKIEDVLFVQREYGVVSGWPVSYDSPKLKDNEFMLRMLNIAYPEEEIGFFKEKITLNCGLFGGHKKVIRGFIEDIKNEIIRINPTKSFFEGKNPIILCVDMAVFNYIVYKKYSESFYTGFPFQNVYSANDDNPFSWFHHK